MLIIINYDMISMYDADKDGPLTISNQDVVADDIALLRLNEIPRNTPLPYKIPDEYQSLPSLNGYATVEMKINSQKGIRLPNTNTVIKDLILQMKVDGYHAPLTAGNFIDLIDKKYYDKMPLQKVEELFIQTGASL
jgi:hypothetical protein